MNGSVGDVVLLSLEPWDSTWRRNQHLAARLVDSGAVQHLLFVEPPAGLRARAVRRDVHPGIRAVTPPLVVPRRRGGFRALNRWWRRVAEDADLLWVNDPAAGAAALRDGLPTVYDVTDDWRSMPQPPRDRARIVAAEDLLAARARTVVCSRVLAQRWSDRYGVDAVLVQNGVDVAALRAARPVGLDGPAPHAVYVGTLHANRVDLDLVVDLAAVATVHLVGPDGLTAEQRGRLERAGVRLHGPVASAAVPSWLVAADVLVCPHVVDDFTLSLDAIKAHEYLATDRPVVATPTSGFQSLSADGLAVVDGPGFVEAVGAAATAGPAHRADPADWHARAAEFAAVLSACAEPPPTTEPHR